MIDQSTRAEGTFQLKSELQDPFLILIFSNLAEHHLVFLQVNNYQHHHLDHFYHLDHLDQHDQHASCYMTILTNMTNLVDSILSSYS